jgi:hypothetical protein
MVVECGPGFKSALQSLEASLSHLSLHCGACPFHIVTVVMAKKQAII